MIQNQKLAATGRIAASLAHEINNPLQAIQGCLELAQTNVGDPAKQRRYLTMATTELEQLASIVRQILDFNRPAKGQKAPVDVSAVVNDVLALSAKRLQHGQVLIQTHWDANVPMIDAVSNQLQQVFLNLILNAIEAMPQGGRLQIRGQSVTLNGNWVTIAFTDSGVGIAPDALDKIFEPFYTTNAEGTGLGLSVCHNLVNSHGGRIAVESAVGRGSTFTVWLPVLAEPSPVKSSD
jgi:signal transduction histidine kinase